MNEQEMQFADPEWKSSESASVQGRLPGVKDSYPQPVNEPVNTNNQFAETFSSYEQGYMPQQPARPAPMIEPVARPATRYL